MNLYFVRLDGGFLGIFHHCECCAIFPPHPKKNCVALPRHSQGRDQNIRLWDLAEGRTAITDSVGTESVGFCRCSLLEVAEGRWLLALPWKGLEEVGELPSGLQTEVPVIMA